MNKKKEILPNVTSPKQGADASTEAQQPADNNTLSNGYVHDDKTSQSTDTAKPLQNTRMAPPSFGEISQQLKRTNAKIIYSNDSIIELEEDAPGPSLKLFPQKWKWKWTVLTITLFIVLVLLTIGLVSLYILQTAVINTEFNKMIELVCNPKNFLSTELENCLVRATDRTIHRQNDLYLLTTAGIVIALVTALIAHFMRADPKDSM